MKQFLFFALLLIGCEKDSPTEPEDCAGVPNGDSVLDDCGVCDSNSSNDCINCFTYFSYNLSSQQAFYYFFNVTINAVPVAADDRVAAFKDDICVGAFNWDTSECNSGVCSVPAMGNDGSDLTAGYMSSGDIPTFKIYDVSAGVIYNTTYIEDIPAWQNFGQSLLSTAPLEAVITSAAPCQ